MQRGWCGVFVSWVLHLKQGRLNTQRGLQASGTSSMLLINQAIQWRSLNCHRVDLAGGGLRRLIIETNKTLEEEILGQRPHLGLWGTTGTKVGFLYCGRLINQSQEIRQSRRGSLESYETPCCRMFNCLSPASLLFGALTCMGLQPF